MPSVKVRVLGHASCPPPGYHRAGHVWPWNGWEEREVSRQSLAILQADRRLEVIVPEPMCEAPPKVTEEEAEAIKAAVTSDLAQPSSKPSSTTTAKRQYASSSPSPRSSPGKLY